MTHWCAVQTHVRSEDKAAFHLRRQGYDVFLPKHLRRRKHARRIDWVSAPLFPRYLFVAIYPDTTPWWAIRSTVGVGSLICFGDVPATVPADIITEINRKQVRSVDEFRKVVAGLPDNRAVSVRIVRQGRAIYLVMKP